MKTTDICTLPKVELHRHLEGSIPIPLVRKWRKKYGLSTPDDIQATTPMDHEAVLDRILYQRDCYQDLESVETLTYEVLKSIAEDNIKLIEIRFSPGFMAEPKNLPFDGIMEATLKAKERSEKDFDIEVGYLLISSRDLGVDVCQETIDLALKWKKEIIGVDLAGPERDFPPEMFEKPFKRAHDAGLQITTHYGEVSDPNHVVSAVQKLKAKRIGHGVQSIHDPRVLSFLVQHKIPLELCPTSNYLTQAIPEISHHPIKKLMEAGVIVTINSDDPTLFDTTLSKEYEICVNELDFTLPQLKRVILNGFEHSFLPTEKKQRAWERHFKYLQ